MQFLRHLRDFFQLTFKVDCKDDEQLDSIPRQTVTLSCVGVGFSNFSRGIVWTGFCVHCSPLKLVRCCQCSLWLDLRCCQYVLSLGCSV